MISTPVAGREADRGSGFMPTPKGALTSAKGARPRIARYSP